MKKIHKATNWIIGVLMITAICAIGSRSWWPTIIFFACWLYFAIMANINGWFYDPETEDEE